MAPLAQTPKLAAPAAASQATSPETAPASRDRAGHSRFDWFSGPSGSGAEDSSPGGSFGGNQAEWAARCDRAGHSCSDWFNDPSG